MFLPFPYFVVSVMLSLPFWLLTEFTAVVVDVRRRGGYFWLAETWAKLTPCIHVYVYVTFPLLFWHDVNFIKLFKSILHMLRCTFFYIYLPSVKLIFSMVPTLPDLLMTFLCGL